MGILCLTKGIIRTIVSIIIVTRSIVPRSVFTKSSSIKLYKEDKRLLFNSDPWPPAEQKLEMPCDTYYIHITYQVKEWHVIGINTQSKVQKILWNAIRSENTNQSFNMEI